MPLCQSLNLDSFAPIPQSLFRYSISYEPQGLVQKIRVHGIRRYGLHSLSYEWIVHSLPQNEPELADGRIIGAHLGSRASLCAINYGMNTDTTMDMTALNGLPIGNLDPGVVIHMIRELVL